MRQKLRSSEQRARLKRKSTIDFPNKLICADLHLTDNVRDEYRWDVFSWLAEIGLKNKCKDLYIIGDLCDRKDHHSAKLVNRIIENFSKLLEVFSNRIIIVKGNHDYNKDELTPFFNFISFIPKIKFINEPEVVDGSLFLPHTRTKAKEWNDFDLNKYSYVYLHATVTGAKLYDGYVSNEGFDIQDFKSFKNVQFISGDVHIPQNMSSNFIYIGSPYPIKFGDNYEGRVLLIKDSEIKSINYESIKKHSWNINIDWNAKECKSSKGYFPGDHVKVTINLHQSEFQEYYKIRKMITEFCKDNKLELFSIEMKPIKSKRLRLRKSKSELLLPDTILNEFCEQQKLSKEQLAIGKELL